MLVCFCFLFFCLTFQQLLVVRILVDLCLFACLFVCFGCLFVFSFLLLLLGLPTTRKLCRKDGSAERTGLPKGRVCFAVVGAATLGQKVPVVHAISFRHSVHTQPPGQPFLVLTLQRRAAGFQYQPFLVLTLQRRAAGFQYQPDACCNGEHVCSSSKSLPPMLEFGFESRLSSFSTWHFLVLVVGVFLPSFIG